jgi:CobQ-like glutamine amidotransferase family enzyme
MSVATEKVVLVQLYPDELGVTGDRGNVLALTARLSRAGVDVEVVKHRRGDILPNNPDIVVIGNGPLSAVKTIVDDAVKNAEAIRAWVHGGVPLLAVGSGMEILGESITTESGEKILGVGALPLSTIKSGVRRVGYVVTDTPIGQLVGFEDHSSTTVLTGGVPFGRVVRGVQSLIGGSDGVLIGSAIGTRIQGPILPLNPVLTDHLITAALERRDLSRIESDTNGELDRLASEARAVILKNIDHDFSSI